LSLAVPPQAPSVDDTDVWKVMKSSLGSILWSQFFGIFANFRRTNWLKITQKPMYWSFFSKTSSSLCKKRHFVVNFFCQIFKIKTSGLAAVFYISFRLAFGIDCKFSTGTKFMPTWVHVKKLSSRANK
jgi:hypothetical protein